MLKWLKFDKVSKVGCTTQVILIEMQMGNLKIEVLLLLIIVK